VSHVTRHTSHVTRHTSHVTHHLQPLHASLMSFSMRHTSRIRMRSSEKRVTRHTSHVTRHTSHVTSDTSRIRMRSSEKRVTRHTSHVTRHTSHVTSDTSRIRMRSSGKLVGFVGLWFGVWGFESRVQSPSRLVAAGACKRDAGSQEDLRFW